MTPRTASSSDRNDDLAGNGVEAGFVLVIFAGGGYLLDRWLGTSPWLLIGLFVLGAIGVFYNFKATYAAAMDAHEVDRQRSLAARRPSPTDDGTVSS